MHADTYYIQPQVMQHDGKIQPTSTFEMVMTFIWYNSTQNCYN